MTPHQADAATLRALGERCQAREELGLADLLFFAASLVEDCADVPLALVADTLAAIRAERPASADGRERHLIDMLRRVEWVRQAGGSKYACPFCHGISERDGGPGHVTGCPWVAAVATSTPGAEAGSL